MTKPDYRSPLIYLLTLFVIVLLIVLKRQQDHLDKLKDDLVFDTKEIIDEPDIAVEQTPPEPPHPPLRGIIGLIIDDFGYRNDEVSNGFLNLPARLTFAVIPGHEHSQSFSKNAVLSGYEVIVHMPMENIGKTFGEEEFVLMNYFQDDELIKRIKKAMNHIPEAKGLNNHQGSRATESYRVMKTLASVLKEENKFFIDSRTTINTLAEETMRQFYVPTSRRNIFLDNILDEEKINGRKVRAISLTNDPIASDEIGCLAKKSILRSKESFP